MFTETFYTKFGATINSANVFSFPLIWNAKEKKLRFSPSLHIIASFAHLYLSAFTLSHFVQTIKYKKLGDFANSTLFLTAFFSSATGVFTISIITFKCKEIRDFFNSGVLFTQKFNGKWWKFAYQKF